ncbi:MAG: Oxidoreductase [Nocardioidaceae bacterium]|nr:Oxidoreductase [Nocardioidaceae bacterium]
MTDRVALVTGAARGIGAATVRLLAESGHHVVALDSCEGTATPYPLPSRGDLDAVAAPYGDTVLAVVADVRDRTALDRVVADTIARWGRLDVAVAAAAVIRGGSPLWETPDADLETLLDVDVRGVWNTAAAVVPAMLGGPDPSGCRFVAVASAAGSTGLFRLAGYTVAKHAVVGLVRGLAADLAGTGVTACAVSPGSTATPMLDATAAIYDVGTDALVGHQGIGRVIDPDEIAATIGFACSPAGAVLHGSVVQADGGFSA